MKRLVGMVAGWLAAWAAAACLAGQVLPVSGPAYWLDVSDPGFLTYDAQTDEILTLRDKSGNGIDFERRTDLYNATGPYFGPVYVQEPGSNGPPSGLPYARFNLRTNLLVQAVAAVTTPRTVFIVQSTTGNNPSGGNGGLWGRWGADRGLRLTQTNSEGQVWWWRNAASVGADPRKRQLDFINSIEDDWVYWTDSTLFDQRQTWFSKEWGITTAYGNHDYGQTSLGVYYKDDFGGRWWAGGLGEVVVYSRHLDDAERHAVENYLKRKWLLPPSHAPLLIVR
jgi:hypothetical protein